MVNRQGLPVHLICHTKPYNNHNFKLMALRNRLWCISLTIGPLTNFGLLFLLVVLFLCMAKLYRSCPIRDKGLLICTKGVNNLEMTSVSMISLEVRLLSLHVIVKRGYRNTCIVYLL